MNRFRESRWRLALPWFILAAVIAGSQIVPGVYEIAAARFGLWIIGGLAAVQCLRRLLIPRIVFSIYPDRIDMVGVEPGWWKLFQRWHTASIPFAEVVDVRVGKIRENLGIGLKLPPLGEPSRGGHLQNFLWVRYQRGGERFEMYYPHLNDIRDWQILVGALKEKLGEKIIETERKNEGIGQ